MKTIEFNDNIRGYESIKRLAKSQGCSVTDLLVLANQNDPFYAGSPLGKAKAEWFANLWEEFGYTTGIHLRRVHYQLVSQKNPRKHDGTPYENTEECWTYLCEAGKAARYLDLVSPDAFVDRRNPAPHIFLQFGEDKEPGWEINWGFSGLSLPSLPTVGYWDYSLSFPSISVSGYDYDESEQPYHIELWVEKSTMDDVLLPICQRFGINLVTSLGFQSITSVVGMFQRISLTGKPARIFYISDFDPAGDGMPVAVARQIEYWRSRYALHKEVKLTPLALTRKQVETYRLPRIPIKESDRRKSFFEERYGEGAVELDALEALYPGALGGIVREAVEAYRDPFLSDRMSEAYDSAIERASTAWAEAMRPYQSEIDEIRKNVDDVMKRYKEKLSQLNAEFEKELSPLRKQLEVLRHAIKNEEDSLELELPDRPELEVEAPNEENYLFDSERDYLMQLGIYKCDSAPASVCDIFCVSWFGTPLQNAERDILNISHWNAEGKQFLHVCWLYTFSLSFSSFLLFIGVSGLIVKRKEVSVMDIQRFQEFCRTTFHLSERARSLTDSRVRPQIRAHEIFHALFYGGVLGLGSLLGVDQFLRTKAGRKLFGSSRSLVSDSTISRSLAGFAMAPLHNLLSGIYAVCRHLGICRIKWGVGSGAMDFGFWILASCEASIGTVSLMGGLSVIQKMGASFGRKLLASFGRKWVDLLLLDGLYVAQGFLRCSLEECGINVLIKTDEAGLAIRKDAMGIFHQTSLFRLGVEQVSGTDVQRMRSYQVSAREGRNLMEWQPPSRSPGCVKKRSTPGMDTSSGSLPQWKPLPLQ